MRTLTASAFAVVMSLVSVAAPPAADEPRPLLKPVVPPSGAIRVFIPVSEKNGITQFKAQIPKGMEIKGKDPKGKDTKGKKGEMIDVVVGIESMPGASYVSTKLWQSWGYAVPEGKIGMLPELVIQGAQLAPKVSKGRDVQVKIPAIRVEIIDPPGEAETVHYSDIFLRLNDVTRPAAGAFEPRFYFPDNFFELTVPATAVKRPGTGDEAPPEPGVTADKDLVVCSSGPMPYAGVPVFKFASVDGIWQYKTPEGNMHQVTATVSTCTYGGVQVPGLYMGLGAARGCKVPMDPDKELKATGATADGRLIQSKVKEFRLELLTGPGLKAKKDLVLKDVPVYVNKSDSGHLITLGPRFLATFLTDDVYSCGPDGVWQLQGRAKPDLLFDLKTRPKMP